HEHTKLIHSKRFQSLTIISPPFALPRYAYTTHYNSSSVTMYVPNTYQHTETIRSPVVDESQPQSGGMKTSTEVGIGIGLRECLCCRVNASYLIQGVVRAVCFLSLILGFYMVSKWRGRP